MLPALIAAAALPTILQMFQKPNTTNFASQMAPMIGSENQSQQSLLDLIAKSPPTFNPISISDLNNLVGEQSMLNALKSKGMEMQTNPALAAMRESSDNELNNSFNNAQNGELPVGVQNALVRAGLGQAIGGGGRISPTSVGKGSMERVFGMGSTDYLDKLRNLVMQKTMGTPRPQAAVDPSSAANIFTSNIKDRDALNNQFQQQLLQATGQANQNESNFGNALASSAVNEGMNNAGIKNAKQGQFTSSLGSMFGGLIKGGAFS